MHAEPAALSLERGHPVEHLVHGERGHLCDAPVADRHGERFGLEALALAGRAWPLAHVPLDVGADVVGGRLPILTVEPWENAFPFVLVRALLATPVLVRQLERVLGPVEDRVDRLLRQRLDRRLERELELAREPLEDRHAVLRGSARLLPRQHRALTQ